MKKKTGFTLIELLIVMLIISIVASVAVITIRVNPQKQYETFGKQLANAILLAEQEALLRPATVGFGLTPSSFQFFILQRDKWVPISKTVLKSQPIPAHTRITLKINGEVVPADGEPKLIISPSNDLTPFVILIGKPGENPYYQIIGKANGEVSSETVKTE